MSSQSYHIRPLEEVQAKIDVYIDQLAKEKGKNPDLRELQAKIKALREEKEKAAFLASFNSLNAKNLTDCEKILQDLIDSEPKLSDGSKTLHSAKTVSKK